MARRSRLRLPVGGGGPSSTCDDGERPLAWASGRAERWLVGTDAALHLDSGDGWRRLGWEHIERADWNHDTDTLAIVEVAGWGLPERRTEFALVDAGQLLELLRERVTKSVVLTVYAAVHGRRGLSVVGRRSPTGRRRGRSGRTCWPRGSTPTTRSSRRSPSARLPRPRPSWPGCERGGCRHSRRQR